MYLEIFNVKTVRGKVRQLPADGRESWIVGSNDLLAGVTVVTYS